MYAGPLIPTEAPTPPVPQPPVTRTPNAPRQGDVFRPDVKLDPSQVTDRRPKPGNVGMYGTVASAQATPASDWHEIPPLTPRYNPY